LDATTTCDAAAAVLADGVVNGPKADCVDWQTIGWSRVEGRTGAAAADLRGIAGRGPEVGPQSTEVDIAFPQQRTALGAAGDAAQCRAGECAGSPAARGPSLQVAAPGPGMRVVGAGAADGPAAANRPGGAGGRPADEPRRKIVTAVARCGPGPEALHVESPQRAPSCRLAALAGCWQPLSSGWAAPYVMACSHTSRAQWSPLGGLNLYSATREGFSDDDHEFGLILPPTWPWSWPLSHSRDEVDCRVPPLHRGLSTRMSSGRPRAS
jgi:hypothetical protein